MISPPQSNSKMVKNCNNLLAENIFNMELREEFSVCLNNEALSRVRVYSTSYFILGKGKIPNRGEQNCQRTGK